MSYSKFTIAILAAVSVLVIVGSLTVAGQSTAGEIRVDLDAGESELEAGESKTIPITYQSPATGNPDTVGFNLEYNPDMINVTDVSSGGYISPSVVSTNISEGYIGYTAFETTGEPVDAEAGTVATITIELADGVDKGDQTDIKFTDVSIRPADLGIPETFNQTITAAEGTEIKPATFSITSVTSTSPVTADEAVAFNTTIKNTGSKSGTTTVSVTNDSLGTTSEDVTLSAGATKAVNLTLQTAADDAGNYTANVTAGTAAKKTNIRINSPDGTGEEREYEVEIKDPVLSKMPVNETASSHELSFDVVNVSTDGDTDNFTVTLPENVGVTNIVETKVTEQNTGDTVELVGNDPADDPNPGNEIGFAVSPPSASEPQDLRVKVEMKLSATS